MKEITFRALRPDDIEVRVAEAKNRGSATLLLYIDSRKAADILNEAVGEFGWQIEYKEVAGQIYGRLSIWDEDRQMWVYKEDTGSESNIEAAKGMSSDIVKRCLARWGCDYLYSSPKIHIQCKDNYYWNDKITMTFSVKEISYEGKKITHLVIVDRFGYAVFVYDNGMAVTAVQQPAQVMTKEEVLKAFCANRKATEPKDKLLGFYNYYCAKQWSGTFDMNTAERLYSGWGRKNN